MSTKIVQTEKDKRGYIPIIIGFVLVIIGLSGIAFNISTNQFSAEGYSNRFNFWFVQAPIIASCLVIGSLVVVVGVAILRKITSVLSYVSIACGFALILFGINNLEPNIVQSINIIGWDNFWGNWAIFFLPFLIFGASLITLGILLGLHVKGKYSYCSIAIGLTFVIFGVATYTIKTANGNFGNLYSGWYWDNFFGNLSPVFLIIGALIVVTATIYLKKQVSQKTFSRAVYAYPWVKKV